MGADGGVRVSGLDTFRLGAVMRVKSQSVRLQLTLDRESRAIAFVLSILRDLCQSDAERIIRTVATHYGYTVEKWS